MKIYTKTGDMGDTSLFAGGRVRKHHLRVEAYGTVDELNSALGMARALGELPAQADFWLDKVQNDLFVLGADLATPLDTHPAWLVRIDAAPTTRLETAIDKMDEDLPALQHFILPGGTPVAAALHVARTVCRRAERMCVLLNDEGSGESGGGVTAEALAYLNRLSDFLFTLARWINHQAGQAETSWTARD